jgi:hypothetical protein
MIIVLFYEEGMGTPQDWMPLDREGVCVLMHMLVCVCVWTWTYVHVHQHTPNRGAVSEKKDASTMMQVLPDFFGWQVTWKSLEL